MRRLILLTLFSTFIMYSCQEKKQEHKTSHHGGTPQLQVTNPVLKDTSLVRNYVSQIHASKHIELRALERGYLQSVHVDEGQYVSKGQLMFQIMPSIYDAELKIMKAESASANIEFQNTKLLSDSQIVSANELALAKAELDRANAEVELAQAHLDFTSIKAPFSGIMDHLEVQNGSLLDEGEVLTTLSDNSKMWVYFNVPEREYLDYITSADEDRIKSVNLEMANGKEFDQTGKIEVIEGEFDNETGNIEFRATFPNPKRVLRHGETGNIKMSLPYPNALIIPQKATFEVLDKKFVYVLDADNNLKQKKIEVAAELPHIYVVSKGLSVDDRILIEGLRKVKDGDAVKPTFVEPNRVLNGLTLLAE